MKLDTTTLSLFADIFAQVFALAAAVLENFCSVIHGLQFFSQNLELSPQLAASVAVLNLINCHCE